MSSSTTLALPRSFASVRKLATLAASIALPMCMTISSARAANCTAPLVDGRLYSIVNVTSGKALDVAGGSRVNGAAIQQWGYGGSGNQQFYARDLRNGYWSITAKDSGLRLEVLNASIAEGAGVVQWAANGALSQEWQLKKSVTGAYNIVARHSSKSITVGNLTSGSLVYQSTDTASGYQRWFFNPASGFCDAAPDGYAAEPGPDGLSTTTGGGSTAPVTVSTCSALVDALKSTSPAVVQIASGTTIDCRTPVRSAGACAVACPSYQDPGKSTYRLPVGTQTCAELGSTSETRYQRARDEITIQVTSNKTLLGLNKDARIIGASLNLSNSKNIIIRNLAIENVNPGLVEAGDGITLANSSHIWIDHVRFSMISDGHIDIQDSKNVTLSWNRFDGINPAVCGNKHHYTNLVLNSQVTLHHNFWDKASGRNPKLDGSTTRAHLFNNYFLEIPYFAINASNGAYGKVEGNYFENTSKPHWNAGNGIIDADIASNRYIGTSATDAYKNTTSTPSSATMYAYKLDPVDNIPAQLTTGTGPR